METGGNTLLASLAILAVLGGAVAAQPELRDDRNVLSDQFLNFTNLAKQVNLSMLEEYRPILEFLPKVFNWGPVASFATGVAVGAAISWYVFSDEPIIIGDIELRPRNVANNTQPAPKNLTYVLVVGVASEGVKSVLGSQEAKDKGINQSSLGSSYLTESVLKGYNVAILQGDPYADMNVREALRNYVDGGGKLIVVGDAGWEHPEYKNVIGWAWPAGEGIPVPAEIVGGFTGEADTTEGSDFRFLATNHPILKGLKLVGYSLEEPSEVFKTVSKGNTIAFITTDEGTLPAIIEGNSGLGMIVYFSYDPGQTPEILLQTINYLTG